MSVGLRAGYKQTEVGVIPEDWEVVQVGEVATKVGSGITPTGGQRVYKSEGRPFMRSQNVGWGTLLLDDVAFIDDSIHYIFAETEIKNEDVFLNITGASIGRSAIADSRIEGGNVNQHVCIIRADSETLAPRFLNSILLSPLGQRQIDSFQAGGNRQGLNFVQVRSIRLPVPPLPEQRAIAAALGDVDALLGGLDSLIAKKQGLKVAAMQQLLTGQTRLPGFSGEWEVKRLGALADIRSGGTPSTSVAQFWDGNIPWCTPTDITALKGQKFLSETSRMITPQGLKASSAEMIPAHSIVMTSRATIGECAINSIPVSTNQGFKNFIPFDATDVDFLYYLLTTQKQGFITLCSGSTFLEIGKTQLITYQVRLPGTKAEQTAIATVLSDMDTEIAALQARRSKAQALKQAMMQELLTGKTRLVEPTSNVIPVDFFAKSKPAMDDAPAAKAHNWAINEAVVVAVLVNQFGSEKYPLGRKRCTKLSYLMHRHVEHVTQGYLKKAAGPYNPSVKYKGPEGIAQKNGYIRTHAQGKFSGFVAAEKVAQAEGYFEKWYGSDVLAWLEQFRYKSNDELELLATVDMAAEDLRRAGRPVAVDAVKSVIHDNPEWEAKLEREIFSDANIAQAITQTRELFQ